MEGRHEAQRGAVTCPRSPRISTNGGESGLLPRGPARPDSEGFLGRQGAQLGLDLGTG